MITLRHWPVLATALALFAMLFGSGNIAFPLGLGRDLGSASFFAMVGFFLTAIFVPVLGVVAMALYDADYRAFMARIGAIPARIAIALCFALMGPLCVIPRCIAFSHLAMQWMIPSLSPLVFSLVASVVMLVVTWRKSGVVDIMSTILGPVKLVLLTTVIIRGLTAPMSMAVCAMPDSAAFAQGLLVGYGTLDLLAVMFFSGLLLAGLSKDTTGRVRTPRERMSILMQAGVLGALLLGILYAGFVMVAARQSASALCMGVEEGQLLPVLASIILGAAGGYLASITMVVACSTTAIALTAVFSEYISTETNRWLSYHHALLATVAIAAFFANAGASGIKAFLAPIVVMLYPALMVVAITNILWKVWKIDLGAWPFYATLLVSGVMQYIG